MVFSGSGVVGEQEADTSQLQKIVVDGLKLVRKRIDPGDREAKVGIEFPGDAEGIRLQPEAEQPSVTIITIVGIGNGKAFQVLGSERNLTEAFGLYAN